MLVAELVAELWCLTMEFGGTCNNKNSNARENSSEVYMSVRESVTLLVDVKVNKELSVEVRYFKKLPRFHQD